MPTKDMTAMLNVLARFDTRGSPDAKSSSHARGWSRWTPAFPWTIGLVTLGCNLYDIGRTSLWYDEAYSVQLARQSLGAIWYAFRTHEPNMLAYYLLLHGWLAMLTSLGVAVNEVTIRLPSAVFGGLAASMVYLLGKRLLGTAPGLLGAVLFAFNYQQLSYAQEARGYSLQTLLLLVAFYALVALFTSPEHRYRWSVVYVLAMTAATYSQIFSVFLLGTQVVTFGGLLAIRALHHTGSRQLAVIWAACTVLVMLLCAPIFLNHAVGATDDAGWLAVPDCTMPTTSSRFC